MFGILAAAIAFGVLATLFANPWVHVSATSDLSFNLDAWALGLGEMVLVTFVEFAVLAVVAIFWRTRWLGVLAVFAGTWWLLLWWVVVQVGSGMQNLLHGVQVRELTLNAAFQPGEVWSGILALSIAMTAWGLLHLAAVHRSGR